VDDDIHQQVKVRFHPVQVGPQQFDLRVPKVDGPLSHAAAVSDFGDDILHGLENGLALGDRIVGEPDGFFGDPSLYLTVLKL
jgi:hypothetical protein